MRFGYFSIFFFICLLVCSSCSRREPPDMLVVSVQPDCPLSDSAKAQDQRVLEARFKSYTGYSVKSRWDDTCSCLRLTLKVSEEAAVLSRIINPIGKLEFITAYASAEILPGLKRMNEQMVWRDTVFSGALFEKLTLYEPGIPIGESRRIESLLGYALPKDTAWIDGLLKYPEYIHLFPPNLDFYWETWLEEKGPSTCRLYALDQRDHEMPYEPAWTKSVILKKTAEGRFAVVVKLKKEYHPVWENYTRLNTNHVIGIVLDGRLLSAPTVESSVSGGQVWVMSDRDEQMTKEVKSILAGGQTSCRYLIVEQAIVK